MKTYQAKIGLGKSSVFEVLTTSLWGKILLSLAFTLLTVLFSQLKIFLPWTPVPVTGQTFAVLMSGVVLGSFWGGLSQLVFITLGLAGLNWFASGRIDIFSFWGTSFGYLIGFVFAAVFAGYVVESFKKNLDSKRLFAFLMVIHIICIYIPGMIVLQVWKSANFNGMNLMIMGFLSFLPIDIVKISMITLLSSFNHGKIRNILG